MNEVWEVTSERRPWWRLLTVAAACVLALQPAAAQNAPAAADDPAKIHQQDAAKQVAAHWASAPVEEVTKSHESKATVDGQVIAYTATAGTLTLRDAKGKPTASIFYTAYTVSGSHRPVAFLYNGGPGSATLWLRMGSFAPERVLTSDPISAGAAPYPVIANPDTLIGATDLVFIDAPGTGYSRLLGDATGKDFYGVDADVAAFTKAITRYITKNKRWDDPKYLFGESYGTTRSGALAESLQASGVSFNGVMLLSSILNYGIRQSGYDQIYVGYLPTYAAVAWYHDKVANKPADLATFVQQAREFASGPYAAALAKGSDLTPQEEDAVVAPLSRFTGLSPAYLKDANLRVSQPRFRKELLRDRRLTIGRYDGRFTGEDADAAGENPEYDASETSITGLYISSLLDRLTRKFDYETDLDYRPTARDSGFDWDFSYQDPKGRLQRLADVTADLSTAMRTNPHLRVLSLNGYFDMATPFFITERDLKHMMLPKALQANLQFRYYLAGHMVYLNPQALHQMRLDVQQFIAQVR
jgi:carboxypeptidase C (cathepsin A)